MHNNKIDKVPYTNIKKNRNAIRDTSKKPLKFQLNKCI